MRVKRWLPVLAVLAGGGLIAWALIALGPEAEQAPQAPPPPLVRAQAVQPQELTVRIDSQGEVAPRTESQLVAQAGGRIARTAADFAAGAFFTAGQPLVWIDDADYRLAEQQALAEVARARAALAQEQAQAQVARQEWRELGRGEPPPLVLRQPQLAAAESALRSAQAAVQQAKLQQARSVVRAPYAGRVRATRANVGQYVAPGTPLADIYATDWAEVRLPVSEKDLAFLPLDLGYPQREGEGTPVTLRSNGSAWQGQVVRTGGTVDPQTRLLDVYARVPDPFNRRRGAGGPALPMGLFVQAEIQGKRLRGVYLLPRRAVREGRVWVVQDGRLAAREVRVLRTRGDEVVVEGGLAPGAQVVTSPLEAPVAGMSVRLAQGDAAAR